MASVAVWKHYIIKLIREKEIADWATVPTRAHQRDSPHGTDAVHNKHCWQANNTALDVI